MKSTVYTQVFRSVIAEILAPLNYESVVDRPLTSVGLC